jgi:hypothetical protein
MISYLLIKKDLRKINEIIITIYFFMRYNWYGTDLVSISLDMGEDPELDNGVLFIISKVYNSKNI